VIKDFLCLKDSRSSLPADYFKITGETACDLNLPSRVELEFLPDSLGVRGLAILSRDFGRVQGEVEEKRQQD